MPISPLVDAENEPPKSIPQLNPAIPRLPQGSMCDTPPYGPAFAFHVLPNRALLTSFGSDATLELKSGWGLLVWNVPSKWTVLVLPAGTAEARDAGWATTNASEATNVA